jgi:hypothetical protein
VTEWGACGGPLEAEGTCSEEPFLHALHHCDDCGSTITSFLRIFSYNGKPQVHEVSEACIDPESVWDVEENCCVVESEPPKFTYDKYGHKIFAA